MGWAFFQWRLNIFSEVAANKLQTWSVLDPFHDPQHQQISWLQVPFFFQFVILEDECRYEKNKLQNGSNRATPFSIWIAAKSPVS